MQDSNIPTKFPIPWANDAGGSFVRSIPEASQIGTQNGAASLTDGFPPLNFLPVAGGGTPPFGADHNGILKQITQWLQWMQAGAPIPYDATFQTAIGGYPKGALVWSVGTPGALWQSAADSNTTNPDSGGAGWVPFTLVDAGAASGVGALILKGSSSFGANLKMIGNGSTTPSKFIRAVNGILQFLNNAYTVAIASLDDTGNFTAAGRLHAGIGAFGSGDSSAASLLGDWTAATGTILNDGTHAGGQLTSNVTYVYRRGPDGVYDFSLSFTMHWGLSLDESCFINIPFGTSLLDAVVCLGSPGTTSSLAANNPGTFAVAWTGTEVGVVNNFVNGDLNAALGPLGMVVRGRIV